MPEIRIDPEFEALIPPLSPEEYAGLELAILERGCRTPLDVWGDILVDGHNRFKICTGHKIAFKTKTIEFADRDAAMDWIDANQLQRRNLSKDQRDVLIERIYERSKKSHGAEPGGRGNQHVVKGQSEPLPESSTAAAVATQIGVSESTVKRAVKKIKKLKSNPVAAKKVADGKTTISKAVKEIHKQEEIERLTEAQAKVTKEAKESLASICDLRTCSCRDLFASGIKPDAVITDPPYPEEFLPVFSELAEACASANVPLVAVMSGQSYLPDVYRRLCEHLTYRWTLAYLTPGGQAVQQWQAKTNTTWKPILLFGEANEWFGDVAVSKPNDNDKRFHGWGQSESGMADLVDRLTQPGQLICDPFLGGGTTAIVSLALGRRFVGCDINQECVDGTLTRVEAMLCPK